MVEHDRVAPLGHDRQFGAGLVRPHAQARGNPRPSSAPTSLTCFRCRPVSAQVWWRFSSGAPDSSSCPAGSRLTVPSRTGKRDDVVAFDHRFPAIAGKRHQQIANAARFVIGRRAVIGDAVDELFVLGADPPALLGLFTSGKDGDQIGPAFDRRDRVCPTSSGCSSARV